MITFTDGSRFGHSEGNFRGNDIIVDVCQISDIDGNKFETMVMYKYGGDEIECVRRSDCATALKDYIILCDVYGAKECA